MLLVRTCLFKFSPGIYISTCHNYALSLLLPCQFWDSTSVHHCWCSYLHDWKSACQSE